MDVLSKADDIDMSLKELILTNLYPNTSYFFTEGRQVQVAHRQLTNRKDLQQLSESAL